MAEEGRLAGRKVLVTGASSGIGADLAVGMAAEGAVVGICARRERELSEVLARCREHSPDARMWVVDLAALDEVAAFALRADDELGGIDVLVNNAGIPKRKHTLDLTPEIVDEVNAVNYLSPVRLTLALVPRMVERGGGRIVTVSSIAARLSPPREAAYSATKAAISAFMESLAVDLWDHGVRVHLVYPGVIDTPLFHLPDNEPLLADMDALPPAELTRAVLDQLDSGAFEVFVPEWFRDIYRTKVDDPGGFVEGSAAFARDAAAARGLAR